MTGPEGLLQGIVAEPLNEDRYQILADWLEEHDDPRRAELLRLHRRLVATCCEPERHSERTGWQVRLVELLKLGVKPCVPQRSVLLEPGVQMLFHFIPPAAFLMGSLADEHDEMNEEEQRHRVILVRGFYLGVFPVTQTQWQAVMGGNPSRFPRKAHPVEGVTWDESKEFCAKLGEGARLPQEAEWEWACRAGTTTPYFFGETLSQKEANYHGRGMVVGTTARGRTTRVGKYPANAWGLHDMHGNVAEWCETRYHGNAWEESDSATGPAGERVLRGGCWNYGDYFCRSAYRDASTPGNRTNFIGFRVCLGF